MTFATEWHPWISVTLSSARIDNAPSGLSLHFEIFSQTQVWDLENLWWQRWKVFTYRDPFVLDDLVNSQSLLWIGLQASLIDNKIRGLSFHDTAQWTVSTCNLLHFGPAEKFIFQCPTLMRSLASEDTLVHSGFGNSYWPDLDHYELIIYKRNCHNNYPHDHHILSMP